MNNTKQTLRGPSNIRIELDAAQIFPEDPGQGAPAMVYHRNLSGTYWCAHDTGELDGVTLPPALYQWLDNQFDAVDAFMERFAEGVQQ